MPALVEPPELLSLSDLAQWLGVHVETIRRWRRAGTFPEADVRIGRRCLRWYRSTISKFLNSPEPTDARDD